MSAYRGTDNLEVMEEALNYTRFLVGLVVRSGGASTLAVDFGAGMGTFAQNLRQHGIEVLCVEPDATLRSIIRRRELQALESIDEVNDSSVQYVYSLNVLEHIEDDYAALLSISRKLSTGGRLLLYVPAFEVLYSSMDRKVRHHRRYTRSSLISLVQRAGMNVLDASYVDSVGFVATLLYKVVGSKTGDLNRTSVVIYDRIVFPLSRLIDKVSSRLFGKNVYLVATK